jgi:lactate racemase
MALALRRRQYDQVVHIDTDSQPRILHYGEDFLLEDLPIGTRVVYPKPPIVGLPNPGAAIRYALHHPMEAEPLHAQLYPGMKVTIAMDDISLPLPPMKTPDVRQQVLEIVLDMLTNHGVDDIHLIVANSLHRKMTEQEMKRMVGSKIFNEYHPDRFYNHDAEDPDGMVHLGRTDHNEPVNINRRAAESDLVIYVNINLVPMDGGHKSVTVGLCDYESLRPHHEPQTIIDSDSYMDPSHSSLSRKCERMGKIVDEHMNVFHIETALNNDMFMGPMSFLAKNEDRFSDKDWALFNLTKATLEKLPRPAKRKMFFQIPANYKMIACYAGKTDPVHEQILKHCFDQYAVPVKGQCDILITGIAYVSPYNVNSILNPILVQVMGPGYFFNMYRNKPVVKKGGVMILTHPCYDEFDPAFHPSYIEFFNRCLPDTKDSFELREKYELEFAHDPNYIQMYRRGNAYHGAHPFFMWYWAENGRKHLSKVIAVADNTYVPEMLGWDRASSLTEAIHMAKGIMGRSAEITMLHHPPIFMSDME